MKKRIVSGITATGNLTLGNYIGAIASFIELQNENELFIFVADLHALTIDIEPKILRENRKKILALYLACGLDPERTTIFFQSEVKEHAQLSWILENQTTVGELERMTQFKDKSSKEKEKNGTIKVKTGLLTYPALMAADILLYNADLVPVGQDQKQHLELARNIATRFNNRFSETFHVPTPFFPKVGAKIMSLDNPEKKMSKSSDIAKSYISLLDDPQVAFNKIKKAVTDSEGKIYLDDKKPGIKNLLNIYSSLKQISLEMAEKHFKDKDYGQLKLEVGNVVKDFLSDLQSKYESNLKIVNQVAKAGAEKAREIARRNLARIERKIGLT